MIKHYLSSFLLSHFLVPPLMAVDHVEFQSENGPVKGVVESDTLILSEERLTGHIIPENIKNLTQLEYVSLVRTNLAGPIPSLGSLTQLKELNVYQNNLISFDASDFQQNEGEIERRIMMMITPSVY